MIVLTEEINFNIMRAVIQRVKEAKVFVKEKAVSCISDGLLVFIGIEKNDEKNDSLWLANKISCLRIFSEKNGLMNKSIKDINGDVIVVSQFTLHAKTKKGNRPSFAKAAKYEKAFKLYNQFKSDLSNLLEKEIYTGKFGEDMRVSLVNSGPVTIIIDTKSKE